MTYRRRLSLAFMGVALLPLVFFALGVRRELVARLSDLYLRRATSLVAVVESDLVEEGRNIRRTLASVTDVMRDDNRLWVAVAAERPEDRVYLRDYAGEAMRLAGLDMLEILREDGTILSSGHFRNEFGRVQPHLAPALARAERGVALLEARTAEQPLLVLAGIDSLALAGQEYFVVGGVAVIGGFLGRLVPGGDFQVRLRRKEDSSGTTEEGAVVVREIPMALVDGETGVIEHAHLAIAQRQDELSSLKSRVNQWFLIASGAAALIGLVTAAWLGSLISKPLVDLAGKTRQVDLDRLDVDFSTKRGDEVGELSTLLGALTERLRASVVRLRDAERRAAVGDLARQVNHDVKNGLIPIRNVVRHLAQVAASDPNALPAVFAERRGTLESSIGYLETLAKNYARLSQPVVRQPCNVNEVIRATVRDVAFGPHCRFTLTLDDREPLMTGDSVMLRRIVENLVGNAVDSLDGRAGGISVSTSIETTPAGDAVRIDVADSGSGMTEAQLNRAFDDFFSTKTEGTGLGLSIVRRLVLDLSGTIRVETEPDVGTRVILSFPCKQGSAGERL
jgi:signal transduction histidine kinase